MLIDLLATENEKTVLKGRFMCVFGIIMRSQRRKPYLPKIAEEFMGLAETSRKLGLGQGGVMSSRKQIGIKQIYKYVMAMKQPALAQQF